MYAKDFLTKTGEFKKKDTNEVINDLTKGTIVGSGIGAGVGLLIGFGKQKNLLLCSFIGATIGGVISRIFISQK